MKHYPAVAEYADVFFRWLPDAALDVLDVGCAGGQLLRALKDRHGERISRLAGVDYAKSGVAWAQEVVPEGEFVVADVTKRLPFEDDSFDLTFCTQALEHITDWQAALKEMLRVTRHHVIVTVPDGARDGYSAHVNKWSLEQFETALKPYGLRGLMRFNTHMPCLLARLYKPNAEVSR
jgi:ubiquinone/menaquinone biosynthesis C-methylase UbiE